MSRGLIFMNPLHDPFEKFSFRFAHKPHRFPRSASCNSRSLSPQYQYQHSRVQSFDSLEIPSNCLHIHECVGKGYFGNVYRGQLREPGTSHLTPVAIKSLKHEILSERGNIEEFLREGEIMKLLNHPNVMRLIGVCYSNDGIPSLVMPFAANGDLRSYVNDAYRQVCVIEVVDFSHQIAQGMAYLNSIGICHRDLAARNCMLTDKFTVRISDFGLAVNLSQDHYGRRNSNETTSAPLRLALKWLPIEVLRNRRCVSYNLDIWSYGIVLWELITRACSPYGQLSNTDLDWFLSSGKRLQQPVHCPKVLYEMMLSCWR